ncbi:MAG: hypothetical protein H6997_10555 [Moraxellaceae bacterium]|nr:hypothetical protein [Pseudomonadales bacterium]MCP5177973.1 hypothetical protein [Moraxellaceae bacterium]
MTYLRIAKKTGLVLASTLLLAACSKDQLVGNGLRAYTIEHALPVILKTDDVTMICHANDGFTPIVKAFTKFNVETDMMLAFGLAGSSICTENQAIEKELWSSLSEKQGWTDIAIDARIAQQLLNKDAARKYLNAYNHTTSYFKKQYRYEFGEGTCPKFKQEVEELLFFVGSISALQAINNDVASGRLINVDMEIFPKVAHAMDCLDNQKWWGFPESLRAALTIILPESPEAETKAWQALQENANRGLQHGMRIGYATYAAIASIKGRDDHLRMALKGFETANNDKINRDYLLLDTIAEKQVRHLANRFWMRLEGRRAPTEGYSQFLDEKRQPDKSLDGMLDDI